MKPYYQDEHTTIYHGDCQEIIPHLPMCDLALTSPPYNMRTRIRNGQYTVREWTEGFSKKYQYFHDALPINDYYEFHKNIIRALLKKNKHCVYQYSNRHRQQRSLVQADWRFQPKYQRHDCLGQRPGATGNAPKSH